MVQVLRLAGIGVLSVTWVSRCESRVDLWRACSPVVIEVVLCRCRNGTLLICLSRVLSELKRRNSVTVAPGLTFGMLGKPLIVLLARFSRLVIRRGLIFSCLIIFLGLQCLCPVVL